MATSTNVRELANPKLLEQIDELFKSGVGEYVALPQVSLEAFALLPEVLLINSVARGRRSIKVSKLVCIAFDPLLICLLVGRALFLKD